MVRWTRIIIPFYALLLFGLACSPTVFKLRRDGDVKNPLRVLVYQGPDEIRISSNADMTVKRSKDNEIVYQVRNKTMILKKENLGTDYDITTESGYLSINGKHYRGSFKLFQRDDSIHVVNILSLESYLYSVVPSEIMPGWHDEALKAQSIAARTYAYHQMLKKNSVYDLSSGTSSQVYSGIESEKNSTSRAVDATEGIIMTHNGAPILALFHSTCGGKTADATDVWEGRGIPYLKSITCTYCAQSPHYSWTDTLLLADIEVVLRKRYRDLTGIKKISFDKRNDRVVMVRVEHATGDLSIPGNTFRLLFPPKTLRSLFFKAHAKDDRIVFAGHGWGHGVGMCQWGADGLARDGKKHRDILSYYYRDVRFERIP